MECDPNQQSMSCLAENDMECNSSEAYLIWYCGTYLGPGNSGIVILISYYPEPNWPIYTPPPPCGDERDAIISEYTARPVIGFVPGCIASPLFRLVSDHLHRLQTVYDERFAREPGPWRSVVAQVADKFLACGVLDHGFARIRCDNYAHEYLRAFSCTCRYVCPSCHAERLAIWTQWLNTTLLAPVPHRQVVLTIPKRLRAYCLYRRRLLGEIARVAARTVTAAMRTLTGERARAVGIVACLQTHGSRANWHPHLHLLVTDGGFRPDGTFVSWPVHDTARLTEAFRRAVLRLFVRLDLFDEDQAAGMLTWPHSGFHVHTAVWVSEDDRAFATRLARYYARNPVALERLTYDRAAKVVTYRSDKTDGPTAGTETVDPLEFLARVLVHLPDKGHVTTRYDGWYANRPRGIPFWDAGHGGVHGGAAHDRADAATCADRGQPPVGEGPAAALLPQIFEVDPLACPTCRGPTRIIACITQASVIDQILAPRRTRPLSPAPTPRHHAGTFGVRVRPTGASDRSPRRLGAHGQRHPPAGPRVVGDRAVCSPDTRPTPIEFPILTLILEQHRIDPRRGIAEVEHAGIRDVSPIAVDRCAE